MTDIEKVKKIVDIGARCWEDDSNDCDSCPLQGGEYDCLKYQHINEADDGALQVAKEWLESKGVKP